MKCIHLILMLSLLVNLSCKSGNRQTSSQPAAGSMAPAVVFDADSAYSFVKCQLDFGPRFPGAPGHDACARYLVDKLEAYGADEVIQQRHTAVNYLGSELSLNNIMARFNPEATDRVLLVAHWDTRPWADADPDVDKRHMPVPGANDGGSGTAVLIELARQFGMKSPEVGVDLLFVDGEDSGNSSSWKSHEETWCLGTQYWVNNMPYTAETMPRYGILLDMVGGVDAKFYREYVSQRLAGEVNDKVWSNASAAGYGKSFINEERGGITDDHVFINRAGIPTIDIIECSHPATGSFSPVWHTTYDDLEHISRSTLKAVGQTVANTVYNEKKRM